MPRDGLQQYSPPPGTEGITEAELAGLVTRDSMIGTARL